MTLRFKRLAALLAVGIACASPLFFAGTRLCDADTPSIDGQRAKMWKDDFDGDSKPDCLWLR